MSLRLITLLPITLLLCACSQHQQDTLLSKVTDYGRDKAGVSVKSIPIDDVEMRYLEREGSGPVVMLVHGFSANKDTWLQFMAHLPRDWHLIAPDLAGHGETSEPASNNYQLQRQSERLQAFSQALQLPKFHIIGSSMGGAIAALYATAYANDLMSLTLLDAAGMDEPNPSEFTQALKQGRNPLIATDIETFETRWDMVMEQPPFVPWPLRPAMIRQTLARTALNGLIFREMLASRASLADGQFDSLLKEHVTMPVLIMWGEQDRVLDVSAAHAFKERLPHAQMVLFPNVGHLPQIEIPKESAAHFAHFVTSI